jgi:RimJ/RimL family protein N-acetyltransferase
LRHVIETDRLLLRRPIPDDIEGLIEVHSHPDVERWMDRFDRAVADDWLARVEHGWLERGYGRMVILDRATGQMLGRGGLEWMDDSGEVELGWTLRREAWGHGYAPETARGVAEWAFGDLAMEQLTSRIEPANERSRKVAAGLGMSFIRTQRWLDRDFDVHAVTRERYLREHR